MSNKESYSQFIFSERASVFLQPWYLDIVCGEENWKGLIFEKDDCVVGVMPIYFKKRWGIRYITQPLFSQYHGMKIIYNQNLSPSKRIRWEHEVYKGLITQIQKEKIILFKQNFSPSITNWLPFYWEGYQSTIRYTYQIQDIENMEKVWKNIVPNQRHAIKKGEKNLVLETHRDRINQFYLLMRESFQKHGNKLNFTLNQLREICTAVIDRNQGQFLFAVNREGILIAGLFLIWDDTTMYYLMGGMDPKYSSSGAQSWLIWNGIELANEKKLTFDFEGSMIKGIEKFFRSFGAVQVPYFQISKRYWIK